MGSTRASGSLRLSGHAVSFRLDRPREEWNDVGFFIDYISLPQFRRSDHDEICFRRRTQHMHLLFCNTRASFCKGVWSIPCRTPFWRLQKFVYGTCGCKGIPVYSVAAGEGDKGKVVTVPLRHLQLGDRQVGSVVQAVSTDVPTSTVTPRSTTDVGGASLKWNGPRRI